MRAISFRMGSNGVCEGLKSPRCIATAMETRVWGGTVGSQHGLVLILCNETCSIIN